jgi:hypothetical protein
MHAVVIDMELLVLKSRVETMTRGIVYGDHQEVNEALEGLV